METTSWTQKALEALNMAGLIEPGCVNLRGTESGGTRMEVGDRDGAIHIVTVHPAARHHPRDVVRVARARRGAARGMKHPETVDHPAHYGGADNPYETIKVIEAWDLGFSLGNAVKYISRAGKKPGIDAIEDLRKAQ